MEKNSSFSFGSIDVSNGKYYEKIRQLNSKGEGKVQRLRKTLKNIKETRNQIEQLRSHGNLGKVDNIESQLAWDNVMRKAAGEKVISETSVVRKKLQRERWKKNKSTREWRTRLSKVATDKHSRQQKRKENLKKRSDMKKNKVMKRLKKKGRIL
ncbi:hypothetical protein SNEBB_002968 [Seison nebaliae]|nr:hypothetical protein SNEBB_002968 [Seison nebaliae]